MDRSKGDEKARRRDGAGVLSLLLFIPGSIILSSRCPYELEREGRGEIKRERGGRGRGSAKAGGIDRERRRKREENAAAREKK